MLIISHVDEGVESMSFLSWIGLMTQDDKSMLEERMEGLNQQMSVLSERLSQITEIMDTLKVEQEKGIHVCREEIRNEGIKRVEGNEHILSVLRQGNEFVQTNRDEVMRGLHLLGNMLTEHRRYVDAEIQNAVTKILEGDGNIVARVDRLQEESTACHMKLKQKTEDIFDRQEHMRKDLMAEEEKLNANVSDLHIWIEQLSTSRVEKSDFELLAGYLRLLIANQLMDQAEELLDEGSWGISPV